MSNDVTPTTHTDRECMLTTIDNPFNPFVQWDEWLRFDRGNGYYTNEYLARVAQTSEELSNEENQALLRQAMHSIADNNPTNMWVVRYKQKN